MEIANEIHSIITINYGMFLWTTGASDKKTAENFGVDYMDVEDFVNTDFGD